MDSTLQKNNMKFSTQHGGGGPKTPEWKIPLIYFFCTTSLTVSEIDNQLNIEDLSQVVASSVSVES